MKTQKQHWNPGTYQDKYHKPELKQKIEIVEGEDVQEDNKLVSAGEK